MNKIFKEILKFFGIGSRSNMIQWIIILSGILLILLPTEKYNNLFNMIGILMIILCWPTQIVIQMLFDKR